MTDMLERAAKAIAEAPCTQEIPSVGRDATAYARAALLAALDPADAKLVERIAKRIFLSRYHDSTHQMQAFSWGTRREAFLNDALAALAAIKSMAQDEAVPQSSTAQGET